MLNRLGSPENPLPAEWVHNKFRTLAKHCLADKQIDEVIELSQRLEKLENVDKLTAILGAATSN